MRDFDFHKFQRLAVLAQNFNIVGLADLPETAANTIRFLTVSAVTQESAVRPSMLRHIGFKQRGVVIRVDTFQVEFGFLSEGDHRFDSFGVGLEGV